MIRFINGYRMADQLEEDVEEITMLLEKNLIKRTKEHEPTFAVLEENLEKVKDAIDKYKDYGYLEILTPIEYAGDCYASGGYDMEVQLNYSHVGIELREVLDNIENETEVFTESKMNDIYNSDDMDKSFRQLLDEMTREALKEKLKTMAELVDTISLWRVGSI